MAEQEEKIVAFYTLGCKLNFAESSSIAQTLYKQGYKKAATIDHPTVCIINTCSVTDVADKKGRQLIHKIHKKFPHAFIIVTGCYAQLKAEEIVQIEGVNLVLGCNDKFDIPAYLLEGKTGIQVTDNKHITPFYGAYSKEDRTRHFLKIQDGCDQFCSYCTIPFARGRSRSDSIKEVVRKAQEIAAEGGKEIILTGVNIGDFGKNTGETLIDLLHALDQVEGILRYRISSIEPDLLTDEMIQFVAQSKHFAPHFHIPLQAGSDEVLRLMRRRYDTTLFRDKVEKIKALMPHAFIGVDVMAGMRGEEDALFEQSYQLIESLPVEQLHVFPYSERAGTMALKIPYKVKEDVKKQRVKRLIELSNKKLADFITSQIGLTKTVLFEGKNKTGQMSGFTENYIRVQIPYNKELINNPVEIMLTQDNVVIE